MRHTISKRNLAYSEPGDADVIKASKCVCTAIMLVEDDRSTRQGQITWA